MADPTGDELRALRERAYGPDADIEGDPVALERLRELEAAASVTVSSVEAAESSASRGEDDDRANGGGSSPVRDTSSAPESPPAAPDDGTASPAATDEPAVREGRRRRDGIIGAIALVLALIAGAALSYGVMQLRPGSVATLAAAPDAEWPEFLGDRQDGSTVFEEFFGLTVAIVPQPWGGEDDVPCLFVLHRAASAAITTVGCGAGGFAPTAALAVTDTFPDELIAEYPVGAALQFVLDDGRVVVYADRG